MKIVICHTDFSLYWLPRITALRNLCIEHDMELMVVEIAGKGSPYNFARTKKEKNMYGSWICLFPNEFMENLHPAVVSKRLFSELDNINPDIILAGAIAFPSGATAVRWARERQRHVIILDDARIKDVPRSHFVNFIKRRIYKNVDAVFIPAASHVDDYKFWGVPEENMFFGVNVVDNKYFATQSTNSRLTAADIRNKYNLAEHFFLGVGRQIPKKNWDVLIKAFTSCIQKSDNGWSLVLVGDGPESPRLKDLAALSNKRIVFLPFQDQKSLCQFYGIADCLVLPSSYGETWGLVVNEAMACQLPVILSRECGCAETLVRDGFNGWLCNSNDVAGLEQVLCKFMTLSDEEKKDMGKRSFDIISNWGLERFCEGAWQAIEYCKQLPPRSYASNIVDRLILNLWKGRYRPV